MAEFGIHPYYLLNAPAADLVLVHGLMGNSQGTRVGKDDKGQRTYWPDWINVLFSFPAINLLKKGNFELSAALASSLPHHPVDDRIGSTPSIRGQGTAPLFFAFGSSERP
jgi:hypothetical protein